MDWAQLFDRSDEYDVTLEDVRETLAAIRTDRDDE